jgi:transcriptional regulator with XRE-family HTH domain
MPVRYGPLERALADVRRNETRIIDDLVAARLAAGLSRAQVGAVVGLSAHEIGRIERREIQSLRFADVARYAAGVGRSLGARLYVAGDAVRDGPQQRLMERMHVRVARPARWRTEVPLAGVAAPDARAWDAVIDGHGCIDGIEGETRLADVQAIIRKTNLKLRDDRAVRHAVLLVADTRANREALRVARDSLRADFPLDTRTVLAALGRGVCPGASGIVVL